MQKEDVINETANIIRKHLPEQYKIYLFGSWVKGNARENSDIDIGILGNKKVEWTIMAKILNSVDEINTLRSIDVVDLKSAGRNFREKVLQQAKPI